MIRQNCIYRYISFLAISILLLIAQGANAQRKISLETSKTDSVPFFNGVAISVDLVGPIQKSLGDYGQYEAALRLNLKDKYFPIIEIGYGMADADDPTTKLVYKTEAPYGKIGVDFNLLKNKHDIYRLFGGFRYAFTSYKFDVTSPLITDPTWGTQSPWEVKDIKASYHWAEAVFGVDVKIWKAFHLGWSLRYKLRITSNEGNYGKSWYVPGYGISDGSNLGGTFNVIFDI